MKTIKLFTFFILLLSKSASLYAQNWLWAREGITTANANASSVIVGANENIYIRGGYAGTLTLDAISLIAVTGSNAFIASSTTTGTFLKGTKITSYAGSHGTYGGFSIQSFNKDNTGNIYLAGDMYGDNSFDTIFTGGNTGYLAKFDSNLNGISVKKAGDIFYGSAFDSEKNTYLAGTIYNNISHIDTFTLYNSNANPAFHPKTFLTKLDSVQKCVWVEQSIGGGGILFQLKSYGSCLYSIGRVDTCFLLDTVTICNTRPNGSSFVAKTTNAGNVIWAKNYTSANYAIFTALDIDDKGNCYISGWLDSTAYFGSDTLYKTPGSNRNTFLAKYDSLGAVVWARHIDCTGDMLCKSITTDSNGNTYLTGNFSGSATFGNDVILAQSSSDGYITRFDKNGNCLGSKTIGNVTSNSIAQDADGNAIVTGDIKTGTTYFDSIPLTCTGQSNFFLAKLEAITGGANSVRMMRLDDRLVIYANPNTGSFTIEVPQGMVRGNRAQLGIYNSTGGVVKDEAVDISNNRLSIDIGSVQKGIYSVTLSSGQRRYTGRVVVE